MDKKLWIIGACILMIPLVMAGSTDTTGFVHYYGFESSPLDNYNASHLRNISITWDASNFSSGAWFNGESSYLYNLTAGADITLNTSGTMSLFAYMRNCTTGTGDYKLQVLITPYNTGIYWESTAKGLWLLQEYSELRIYAKNGSRSFKLETDETCSDLLNKWYFHTITYDYTPASCALNLYYYRNGESYANTTGTLCNLDFDLRYLRIGRDHGTRYYFNGSIDEVMFATRKMSQEEIKNMYDNYALGYRPIDTIPPSDTCSCPVPAANWFINSPDHCNITAACDITGFNLTITNGTTTDKVTINATLTAANYFHNYTGYTHIGSLGYLKMLLS